MILLAELMTLFYLPLWFVFTTNLGKWVLIYCYSCDVTVGCDDALNRAHGWILSSPRGLSLQQTWENWIFDILLFLWCNCGLWWCSKQSSWFDTIFPQRFVLHQTWEKGFLIYCFSCDVTMGCDDALNRAHGLILSSPRGWIYNKAWGNELDYIVIFCDVARGRDDTLNRAHGLVLLFSLLECCFSAIFRGQGSFR